MLYGLKYVTQFNSQPDADNPSGIRNATVLYTLQFLFKNYTGIVQSIKGGTTTAVQKCTLDDPLAPIKGQALDIQLLNYGNLPITSFYSDDDAGVQVILSDLGGVRFIGFIVQDDCSEVIVDYVHGIQLSATDGLGLLKKFPLNEAPASFDLLYTSTETITTTSPHTLQTDLGFGSTVQLGDRIRIIGTAQAGDYTVQSWIVSGTHYNFTVLETIGTMASTVTDIGLLRNNLSGRVTLLSVIKRCLSATNISIFTNIFCNLRETRQTTTESHFAQTQIDTQSFVSGTVYRNCFDVLSDVLETFECQLFQCNGEWIVIHWFELRKYTGGAISGFIYDQTFTLLGTTAYGSTFNIGRTQLSRPLFSLLGSVLRPYKFTRKQFNYVTPKYLLKNYDLQTLGALLRQYTSGTTTVKEYVATDWTTGQGTPLVDRFIRIDYDSLGNEIRRYLVTKNSGDQSFGVRSAPIEVSAGDKIKFSFSFLTTNSQAGSINYVFIVQLTNGTLIRYIDELPVGNGSWTPTFGFTYNIPSGDNSNTWHNVEIESSQVPFDGIVYCYLPQATFTPNSVKETWIRDIRFEVITFINDSAKVIGHYHLDNRTNDIKNNLDEEIEIDDSPRNTIGGTLFMPTFSNLIQDRTVSWKYGAETDVFRIGNITTAEILTVRDTPRSKLEGGCVGLLQNGQPVSLGANIVPDFYPTKTYIFGLLTVDYKRNIFSGTMWEIADNSEVALAADYTFNYIYSTT